MDAKLVLISDNEKHGMTYGDLKKLFLGNLTGLCGTREANNLFYLVAGHYSGMNRAMIVLHNHEEVPENLLTDMLTGLKHLQAGKPLQYIIGVSWFNDLQLKVTPDVLIPRQETMQLCTMIGEQLLGKGFPLPFRILDIGTGSGCIAIDLKSRFPHTTVTAVDISPRAIEVAAQNALVNKTEISFAALDITNPAAWSELDHFELIVSNPPYIPLNEMKEMDINVIGHEPFDALFVPDDDPLLFFRNIYDFSRSHLVAGGAIYMEIHEHCGLQTMEMAKKSGFPDTVILKDLNDRPRFVRSLTR